MSGAMQEFPLKGIKVVEIGTLIAGPYAAAILAQFGAEVIKIESPGSGDPPISSTCSRCSRKHKCRAGASTPPPISMRTLITTPAA
jgi:crotonobetainyl-CoA:carnitine CoA-transferase CaiB-like acyl-CoA transferase